MDLFAEASGDRSIPLLVDITGTPSLTRNARVAFSQRCPASRIAVLGNAPTHQVMASFLEVVTTFPVPVRYFTSERAAVKWLSDGAS